MVASHRNVDGVRRGKNVSLVCHWLLCEDLLQEIVYKWMCVCVCASRQEGILSLQNVSITLLWGIF